VQQGLPRLLALAQAGRIRMASVEIRHRGITQHGPGWPMTAEAPLRGSDLQSLRSFLDAARRNAASMPVLAGRCRRCAFQHDGSDGPITIAADLVSAYLAVPSRGRAARPPSPRTRSCGTALAHETGGHDVTMPIRACSRNSRPGCRRCWRRSSGRWACRVAARRVVVALARRGGGGCLRAAERRPRPRREPRVVLQRWAAGYAQLRMTSSADASGLLDPHPTDLLRLHMPVGRCRPFPACPPREP